MALSLCRDAAVGQDFLTENNFSVAPLSFAPLLSTLPPKASDSEKLDEILLTLKSKNAHKGEEMSKITSNAFKALTSG
jgi:hypothetical protein